MAAGVTIATSRNDVEGRENMLLILSTLSPGSYSDGVPLRTRLDGYAIEVLEAEDIEAGRGGALI